MHSDNTIFFLGVCGSKFGFISIKTFELKRCRYIFLYFSVEFGLTHLSRCDVIYRRLKAVERISLSERKFYAFLRHRGHISQSFQSFCNFIKIVLQQEIVS